MKGFSVVVICNRFTIDSLYMYSWEGSDCIFTLDKGEPKSYVSEVSSLETVRYILHKNVRISL